MTPVTCSLCNQCRGDEFDERDEFAAIAAGAWICEGCMMAAEREEDEREKEKAKYAAEKREAARMAQIRDLTALSMLPSRFSTWDTDKGDNRLWGFVNANKGKSIYLASKASGVGKTCALACAARNLIAERMERVLFCRCTKLMRRLTGLYGESVKSADAEMERVAGADLLILDDLLKEKITERTAEILWDIIDERYLMNRRTWITANCGGVEIEKALGSRGQYVRRRIREDFEFLPIDEPEGLKKLERHK